MNSTTAAAFIIGGLITAPIAATADDCTAWDCQPAIILGPQVVPVVPNPVILGPQVVPPVAPPVILGPQIVPIVVQLVTAPAPVKAPVSLRYPVKGHGRL